jgi:hypothetical protein
MHASVDTRALPPVQYSWLGLYGVIADRPASYRVRQMQSSDDVEMSFDK